MACDVKVLAKSRNPVGVEISTLQLRYWRSIHAEMLTHRVFSRNASSSRAVPVKTMLKQVWNDPAGPIHWGANQSGMQARNQLQGWRLWMAKKLWLWAGRTMCVFAWLLMHLGLHKQVANRLLEPWQYIHVVVTSTEWANFFLLRDHPDAQPEIRELAQAMNLALSMSQARQLKAGEWHLPYVDFDTNHVMDVLLTEEAWPDPQPGRIVTLLDAIKASVARCARTSYITHGDAYPNVLKDFALHDRLVVAEPLHASPAEHQAMALEDGTLVKNFRGFRQYRDMLEQGLCPEIATMMYTQQEQPA